MNIEPNATVRELVLGIADASRIFEKHRIDYCCGGGKSLREACASRGLDCDSVVADLLQAEAERSPSGAIDWRERPLRELTAYIRATHHEYTRQELARLRAPLEKVVKVHGARHPELATVKRLFDELESDLLPHMMKEERILFPFVDRLDATPSGSPVPQAPFGSVANPVRMMTIDHERDGALLEALRAATRDFTLPADACTTFGVLYEGLKRLDADLRRHIHLENNVLFLRAIDLERRSAQ